MVANDLSQAELAGRIFKTAEKCPVKGELIRDFELISTGGYKISVSDYRGRSNLVLVFVDGSSRTRELLAGLAESYGKIQEEQSEVLAVVQSTLEAVTRIKNETRVAFPLLVDADGRMHRLMGAQDGSGQPAMAIYITDRFAEVFAAFLESEKQGMPGVEEILGWLVFVNSQCPECSPPEWPV